MSFPDKDIALYGQAGSYAPTPLFAGDQDVITDTGLVAPNQTLAKLQVVAYDANGQFVPWAPAATDTTKTPVGIISQAITTGASAASIGFYRAGFFNFAALVVPNGVTKDQLKAAFGTAPATVMINIGSVRL